MNAIIMKRWEISVTGNIFPKHSVLLLVLCYSCSWTWAQKNVRHQSQIWHGIYVNLPISKHFQLGSEIQERHFVAPVAQQQFLVRNQLFYNLLKDAKAIFGISHFQHGPSKPDVKNAITIPEWRLEIGLSNRQAFKNFSLQHRYRWESRFYRQVDNNQLSKKYSFSNFRFRYQLGIDIPLIKRKSQELPFVTLKLREEVMLNIGTSIVYNIFDQNRLSAGLCVMPNEHSGFEIAYLNLFQQQARGTDFYYRNILRLSFYYNI